ncbi:MAG: hypothetical protein JJU06_08420 [Ectothiorhodospiraceae bacterium]|nr:hypothetical protein [Ectothiorhodospiraceae bacterium]MCH8505339.1 hypothetical protein [Ectothiorhodospiraceae bacterium]
MTDSLSDDDPGPMSPSDSLELVLELAQRRFRRNQRARHLIESQRLAGRAALEQLDYWLMDHWEELDALSRPGRQRKADNAGRRRYVWRLRNGVRIEQSPAEALELVVELADDELRDNRDMEASHRDAVRWARHFLERRASELDTHFGVPVN